jgi:very-short-patch-repair endonuclease
VGVNNDNYLKTSLMSRQPILKYNPKLKDRARELRSQMTEAEVKLWQQLRMRQVEGIKFFRQRPIGNYIVDFYAPEAKLVIEIDGGQHYNKEGLEYDEERDAFLEGHGLKVIRFSNLDVLRNTEGVVEKIIEVVGHHSIPAKRLPEQALDLQRWSRISLYKGREKESPFEGGPSFRFGGMRKGDVKTTNENEKLDLQSFRKL